MNESKKYYWRTLYDGMMSKLCKRIEAHNARYPQPDFKASYPFRIKKTEINTLHCIIKMWAKQQAKNIHAGRSISNCVSTNNRDAQGRNGHSTNTARHLGKLALAGFLLSENATAKSPVRYRCQFTQKGKGYGVVPLKDFHGSARNYDLLIDPALIPIGCVPPEVPVLRFLNFFEEGTPLFPLSISEKSTDVIAPTKLSMNQLPQKVSPEGGNLDPREEVAKALARLASGDAPTEDFADGKRKEIAQDRGRAKFSGAEIAADAEKQGIFARLHLAGQEIAAFAVLLIQSYLKNLAPAMGREYVPAEIERGMQAAKLLIASTPAAERSAMVDRYILTIDHMAGWIRRDPTRNWVLPPSKWFDPRQKASIVGAERLFLRKYEETAASWKDANLLAAKVEAANRSHDEQKGRESAPHALALMMKKHLMHLYPGDSRVRTANLDKWAVSIRLMHRQDKISAPEIRKVALWYFKSEDAGAKFWRQVGGLGIRSTSGFRKRFRQMQHQMHAGK